MFSLQVIQQSFRECGPYLQFDIVDREVFLTIVTPAHFTLSFCLQLKPLGDTIAVLRMDLRRMAQFVRNDLYVDFGRSTSALSSPALTLYDPALA